MNEEITKMTNMEVWISAIVTATLMLPLINSIFNPPKDNKDKDKEK